MLFCLLGSCKDHSLPKVGLSGPGEFCRNCVTREFVFQPHVKARRYLRRDLPNGQPSDICRVGSIRGQLQGHVFPIERSQGFSGPLGVGDHVPVRVRGRRVSAEVEESV